MNKSSVNIDGHNIPQINNRTKTTTTFPPKRRFTKSILDNLSALYLRITGKLIFIFDVSFNNPVGKKRLLGTRRGKELNNLTCFTNVTPTRN